MSDIGPELPPHLLVKRKRKQEEAAEADPTTSSGAKQSQSPDGGEKRRRVMGPAMPPAPLDERPQDPLKTAEESESDDDDGFGPALPRTEAEANNGQSDFDKPTENHASDPGAEEKLKRDDWMMMPPKQDDLAARMDPGKQRARGFNTGKGAKLTNTGDDDSSAWYETAEQKQKRLADEMMGVSKAGSVGPSKPKPASGTTKDEAAARKIREQVEKTRGPSLMNQHTKTLDPEAEDDPSKRSFDREKDMGAGMRIGEKQRKEMLNKASGFSSKFSGGSYL